MATKILSTASYADLKKWIEANKATVKSLPKSIQVGEKHFQIRSQSLEPLRDYYTAMKDKAAIALLETAEISSGRKQPAPGDQKEHKVGDNLKVVLSAAILGVKQGDFVSVAYGKDSITITKKTN